MLSTIAEIIRDLLIFVGVIAALLIALVVAVSKMPNANPLKGILTALYYRLAATLAARAVAIPLEPIPGIDLLYDIGVPIDQPDDLELLRGGVSHASSSPSAVTLFLSRRFSRVRSATTSLSAVASRRRSLTSSEVAARAVSPARRFLPASRN